jgi:epsilon-lactone hydrolase
MARPVLPVPGAGAGDPQPVLTPGRARRIAAGYLAGHRFDDPVVSPLSADLTGLPAMLVQAGTGDPLREEARRLADRASSYGTDVRLDLYPVETHVFHTFRSFLPEAADALRQAAQYIEGS